MLPILTTAEARRTILRRKSLLDFSVPPAMREGITRIFGEPLSPDEVVAQLLRAVRDEGDDAIRSWTQRIDGIPLAALTVPEAAIAAALAQIPAELRASLEVAADRIRAFHALQPLPDWTTTTLGGRLGQRVTPLASVGVYVPGGTAPLPSSLLMGAIPAQVAGVEEIIVATPPGPDGLPPPVVLAAAGVIGIDRIVTVGGALAVAALTFGTESVPAVDKIVGPGNLFVTLAKRQVFGLVGIEALYGPTETIVVADASARADWVAADLLAQAEHDVLATAILVTPSRALAEAVQVELGRQLEQLSRAGIIAVALENQGGIVLTADLAEAAAVADEFAAEHVCLAVDDPAALASLIRSGGGLFLGERSCEVLGDYVAGPSHSMPTNGTARFSSPLNVLDFVRINSIVDLDDETARRLSVHAARIADAEQLTAHARAARFRAEGLP